MSLSSLIVQRGLATIRDVEEALARQVLYGGDLTTNLLEVVRIDEDVLEPLLGEAFGIEPVSRVEGEGGRELPVATAESLRHVSSQFAATHGVYPLAVESGTLVVAVVEPLAADVVSELGFATGLFVVQRIATALRIREAIASTFGLPLDRRYVRLLAKLRGEELPVSLPPSVAPPPPEPPGAPAQVHPSRVPGPATQRLASAPPRAPSVAPPAAGASSSASQSPPRIRTAPIPAATTVAQNVSVPPASRVPTRLGSAPPPLPERAKSAPPASNTRPPRTETAPVTAVLRSVSALEIEAGRARANGPMPDERVWSAAPVPSTTREASRVEQSLVKLEGAKVRPPRRRRGPLTLDAATHELEEAVDRDTVFDVVFDFTRQFFEYTAAFVVHGDVAEGRDAFGSGCPRDRIVEIGIPLTQPSLFWQARNAQSTVKLRASPDGLDPQILDALALRGGTELAVVPIVVRKRAVAFVVGDAGGPSIESLTLRELAQLGQLSGVAFERLILRKKLGGQAPVGKLEPPSTNRPPPTQASPLVIDRLPVPAPAPPSQDRPSPSSDPPAPERLPMLREDPPPATVVAVRRPSGPPIPREETAIANVVIVPEQRSVPPRKPPTSRNEDALPSVIVASDDYAALLQRYLAHADEEAETALLHAGQHAMAALMATFPGPLTVDIVDVVKSPTVRASECGPLLRLVARQRRVALPFVLAKMEDIDERVRFWAVFLLTELPYHDAVRSLIERVFDPDARVRMAAGLAARALSEQHAEMVVERLAAVAADMRTELSRRVTAVDALGELREAIAVPLLINALADVENDVAAAARHALVVVLRHDFGRDPATWLEFWRGNGRKPRAEWLIDAIAGDDIELATAAANELLKVSKNAFGYSRDLSLEERRAVRARFATWWQSEGCLRGVRV